jgi:hypothetical protein
MGAWGVTAFDNDAANDWAYGLDDAEDLSVVEEAFDAVDEVGDDFLDSDVACEALAACELLARLQGRPGYKNAYTERVDAWVEAHPQKPSDELIADGGHVIARVLGENSELRELWEESKPTEWHAAMNDLKARLLGP